MCEHSIEKIWRYKELKEKLQEYSGGFKRGDISGDNFNPRGGGDFKNYTLKTTTGILKTALYEPHGSIWTASGGPRKPPNSWYLHRSSQMPRIPKTRIPKARTRHQTQNQKRAAREFIMCKYELFLPALLISNYKGKSCFLLIE